MRVPYTLKPIQNNPGSNYRPGCSAKPFLPSPFSPAQRKKNSALSACWGGRRTLPGRISTKTTTAAKQRRRCERHGYDSVGSVYTATRPPPSAISTTRGCVCVGEGAVRGRRHRRVSLLLASIRALPFPRKGMRKRRVTRPARERNVACTA